MKMVYTIDLYQLTARMNQMFKFKFKKSIDMHFGICFHQKTAPLKSIKTSLHSSSLHRYAPFLTFFPKPQ